MEGEIDGVKEGESAGSAWEGGRRNCLPTVTG